MRACRIAASISASVVTTRAGSGMYVLPKCNEFAEVLRHDPQYVLHIAPFGTSRPCSVPSISQCNRFVSLTKFHDGLRLRLESMHMAGLVVLRICEEANAVEPERTHEARIRHLSVGNCCSYTAASACSRSSIRSSLSSIPIDKRTLPSLMPINTRSSAETDPCVVVAECDASDSTPPSDSAFRKILIAPRKRAAASREPRSQLIMEPKPFCCFTARSCCGWLFKPG